MSDLQLHQKLERRIPVAPLELIVLPSAEALGKEVNDYLVSFRKHYDNVAKTDTAFEGYVRDDYRMHAECVRFGTGEGKGVIVDSCRGKDIFILTDVTNHSLTYKMNGFINHMSPDDHFQDLKRIVAAINGKASRISVIMPFLYEGRQHKRSGRESLDAANMFRELVDLGVKNFITFDAHDPRIQNVAPLANFDNFISPYQFLRAIIHAFPDVILDKEHFVVISPDEGALDRAVYFAGVISADTGMFYKRRDYSRIVNGKNPIVAHEFLGSDLARKDVIVMDDMISSGDSMIDVAYQLKERGASKIFVFATFGLFCNGLENFDKAYNQGLFNRIYTTNLNYRDHSVIEREWYREVSMCKYVAYIIDTLNRDESISDLLNPVGRIHNLIDQAKLNY